MARSTLFVVFCWMTIGGFTSGCTTPERKVPESFDQAAEKFQHLARYEAAECTLHVQFAEPIKSAWLSHFSDERSITQGSSTQIFSRVEDFEFSWQTTPYRCRIVSGRTQGLSRPVKEVLEDTQKKLETVMCIWVQSFYADSPVRGWRKGGGEPEILPTGYKLQRGEGRALEISQDLKIVRANLSEDASLSAQYDLVGTELYPMSIEYVKHGQKSSLDQIQYQVTDGVRWLESLWVNLPDLEGRTSSYFKVTTHACSRKN